MIVSILAYVVPSLLGKPGKVDMDKLLQRGPYAVEEERVAVSDKPLRRWQKRLGITDEFNLRDRFIYLSIMGWTVVWGIIFVIGTIYALQFGISKQTWAAFWHFFVWLILVVGAVTTVWFTIGGLIDMKKMFHKLATIKRDDSDDGEMP